ncbi:MAG: tRNA dihydrouridine synthase DusB [Zoogloeaceae bacterium]|nr:tRNA dihydrouridine synthase DusB [Zoogloeaceae bacterium]
MQLAGFSLRNNLFVAPMAGVSDRPYRQVCKALGAGLAISEMVTSNTLLYATAKTRHRTDHTGESGPIAVQIAGADPAMMAEAARHNVDRGAHIIDINMGCPAKKVCNVMAGSALLQDEALVGRILDSVVAAVPDTPVTLKIRTGWSRAHRNAPRIARIAESAGIRLLTIHGRTREDAYMGEAEYDTIAAAKTQVAIPVIANGDIASPEKAHAVLARTGADGVMIGRGAQGRPWLFREIEHFLATGRRLPPPSVAEVHRICRTHLAAIHAFYGEEAGVRIARKHMGWYAAGFAGAAHFRKILNAQSGPEGQFSVVDHFFAHQAAQDASHRVAASFPEELAA